MSTRTEFIPTRMGSFKASWSDKGLRSLTLEDGPDRHYSKSQIATALAEHFRGSSQDFSFVPLDLSEVTDFAASVYRSITQVKPGQVTSYGQIAKDLGKPGAARAVGTALGKNPILVLVPCHRVLAGQGKLGGFSAPGGLTTKELMLAAEGFGTESLWQGDEMKRAEDHLSNCPHLGPIVKAVGPCGLQHLYPNDAFAALARAILYQQLATKAAQAIESRVKALGSSVFPNAQEIDRCPEENLRKAGVSSSKVATLKRLAKACLDGSLPAADLRLLPNSQVETQVSALKGLGVWSARMFLLAHLGRRDIFPVGDLGIRKAIQALFSTKELPNAKFMERKSKAWKPYRSVASWYLWRSLEL